MSFRVLRQKIKEREACYNPKMDLIPRDFVLALLGDTEKQLREDQDTLWEHIHNFSFDLQKEVSELISKNEMNAWQFCFYLKGKFDRNVEVLGVNSEKKE